MNTEMVKKLLNDLQNKRQEFMGAVARNSGVAIAKTELMNMLFSRLDEILSSLSGVVEKSEEGSEKMSELQMEVDSLKKALEEADAEYAELNKKYKAISSKKNKPSRGATDATGGG